MTWLLGGLSGGLLAVIALLGALLWGSTRRRDAAEDKLEPIRTDRDQVRDQLTTLREEYGHALEVIKTVTADAEAARRELAVVTRQRDRMLAAAAASGDAHAVAATVRAELQALREQAIRDHGGDPDAGGRDGDEAVHGPTAG